MIARPAQAPGDPAPERGPTGRGRTFGRDVALLALVRLAATAAGFLTSVLAARVLGPAALGAGAVGLTLATIAALLANGGLNISSIYFLGRRPEERRLITHRSFTLGLCATALAALLVLLAAPVVSPTLFGTGHADLLLATALVAAGIVSFELSGSLLLGLDRRTAYLRTQVIEGVGSLFLVAGVFFVVTATPAGYLVGAALAALLAAGFATVVAQRTVGGRMAAFDVGFARESLALGLRGQVGNVLQQLNLRLDLLLVPLFVDLRAAGVYLIAVRMSEVVSQIASASSAYLFPAVSRRDAGDTALTERTVRITLIVVMASGLVIALLAPLLLEVFFGPDYAAGAGALRITMVAMIPLSLNRLMAGDLKGRGRAGLVSISAGCALVATVAFDLLLIPPFGIEGASLASLIAYSIGACVLLAAYRRVTGSSLRLLVPTVADARLLVAASLGVVRRTRS